MLFISLLYILFFCVSGLCFFDEEKTRATRITFWCIIGALFLLAAFRPIGIDKDSYSYVVMFNGNSEKTIEFTFDAIAGFISSTFNEPRILFIFYALLSVLLRGLSIMRNTTFWLLGIVVWMGNFYLYQDLTQIRMAVAAALFLLGFCHLSRGEKWKYFLFALAAACFHYAATLLVFLTFFGNKPLSTTWKYVLAGIPLFGYLLYFTGFDPVVSLPIPYVQEQIWAYELARDKGLLGADVINVFNIVYVLRLLVFYVLLWKYELIREHVPNLALLLKIFAISYFCFTAFGSLPVLAFRYAELFGVVEIFMIPALAFTVKPEAVGRGLVVLFAFGCMTLNIFYNELLTLS